MTIKPWKERPVDQRNEIGSQLVNMQDEIDELRAEVEASERNIEQLTDDLARSRAELAALKALPVPINRHELASELRDLIDLHTGAYDVVNRAADFLEAQPVQEPVAWMEEVTLKNGYSAPFKEWRVTQNPSTSNAPRKPLYLAAPVQPAPLTDKQVAIALETWFSNGLEGKLEPRHTVSTWYMMMKMRELCVTPVDKDPEFVAELAAIGEPQQDYKLVPIRLTQKMSDALNERLTDHWYGCAQNVWDILLDGGDKTS